MLAHNLKSESCVSIVREGLQELARPRILISFEEAPSAAVALMLSILWMPTCFLLSWTFIFIAWQSKQVYTVASICQTTRLMPHFLAIIAHLLSSWKSSLAVRQCILAEDCAYPHSYLPQGAIKVNPARSAVQPRIPNSYPDPDHVGNGQICVQLYIKDVEFQVIIITLKLFFIGRPELIFPFVNTVK